MFNSEVIIFIVYLVAMIAIGLYFFIRSRGSGEKSYFLGGRQMGAAPLRQPLRL